MGDFEDLIERARGGDSTALDKLASQFSGTELRKKAEGADALSAKLKEQAPYVREAKFNQLVKEGEFEGLTLDDLGDVSPEDLTPDFLKGKAETKQASMLSARKAAAEDAGFDSVEEYNEALKGLKEKRSATKAGLEAVGGATSSGSGGTPGADDEPDAYDTMVSTFDEAKTSGKTDDMAMGEAAEAMFAVQAPAPGE